MCLYVNEQLTGILPKREGLKYKAADTKIGSVKYLFLFQCVYVQVLNVCMWGCGEWQRSTTGGIHLQKLSTLFLETGSLTGTWVCRLAQAEWSVSPRNAPASTSSVLGLQVQSYTQFSTWALRVELRSSYLLDKHFAD